MNRAIVVVLDGCGAGAAPDCEAFGDPPTVATIRNVWEREGPFEVPNLQRIGFMSACGVGAAPNAACFGRMRPLSMGKDSVTGHWEMMGIVTAEAFPTYPSGFPARLIEQFESRIGRSILGNVPESGTEIIARLAAEHVATGKPIVYTSADSVFQIAAHESIVPLETLYEWCRIARELCVSPDNVQRVIARPFAGEAPNYARTNNRKDFPVSPPPNIVDRIASTIEPVRGIGVVPELFNGRGFQPTHRTQSNPEHWAALREAMSSGNRFIFANFEDFDMKYGHRSDPEGFARCLVEFDTYLGDLLLMLRTDDLLILTADHGNDPTDASTDHTREYVPLAIIQPGVSGPMGDTEGMGRVGELVVDWLEIY